MAPAAGIPSGSFGFSALANACGFASLTSRACWSASRTIALCCGVSGSVMPNGTNSLPFSDDRLAESCQGCSRA
eukprot:5903754-Pyramimonas_sp.AAC.1